MKRTTAMRIILMTPRTTSISKIEQIKGGNAPKMNIKYITPDKLVSLPESHT